MKFVLICICAVAVITSVRCNLTEAQMRSAAKLIRNVCQPKTKISNAQVDGFHNGDFTQDAVLMNYMECCLRTAQLFKDGKLNSDFLAKQLLTLPASIAEGATITAEHCKDAGKGSDKFVASYEYYKCFYTDNPSNFFLP